VELEWRTRTGLFWVELDAGRTDDDPQSRVLYGVVVEGRRLDVVGINCSWSVCSGQSCSLMRLD
jgi:hypothetical protein